MFVPPITDLGETLRLYRQFTADVPDELGATVGILDVPPSSDFPAELHSDNVTQVTGYHTGDVEEGERALQPMRVFGDPRLEDVRQLRYGEMEDDLLQAGRRDLWKNHCFTEITDEAIETFVEHALAAPADDQGSIDWTTELHEALLAYGTGGEYINNQTEDDEYRVRAAYGDHYERLQAVKNEWDPENLFHVNHNINPTV